MRNQVVYINEMHAWSIGQSHAIKRGERNARIKIAH